MTEIDPDYRLLVRDAMALTIATAAYRHEGHRVTDMLTLVGYTEHRFWQRVMWVADQEDAGRIMPRECRILRERRDRRKGWRGTA